jgi:hypothetical protein
VRGIYLLILFCAGVLLWRTAPYRPIMLRGLVMGLGWMFMAISLYGVASKLEEMRKQESKRHERKV